MSSFISALIRYRWWFFLGSLVLLGGAGAGLKHFVFDGTPRAFFAKKNPAYERFQAMENTYGSDFRIFFMLSARKGTMFDPNNLQALREMTKKSWELPFVRRVDSLANFQYTHSKNDELFVDDFFGKKIISNPQALAERKAIALKDPDVVNRLVTPDGKHASLVLALNLSYDQSQSKAADELVEKAKALQHSIEAKYPNITIAATGNLLSTYYNLKVAQSDMGLIVPVMFGLMFLILGFMLRSVSVVVISLVVAICSAFAAVGFSSWCGITFSILSVNAIIVSIIVAVAHCIHIFTQLFQELKTKNKADALAASLHINFFAVSMTTLTTLIGFLSLNTNDLPPAVALGNAAAIGAAAAWLLSLTMLPALVMLMPFKAHKTNEFLVERVMNSLAELLIARRYTVLIIMAGLSGLMVYLSFQNQLNDRLTDTLHRPHIFRHDTSLIDKHFGALYIDSFNLDSGKANNIVDPTYLKNMDKFATYLRQQPEITSVHAFSDVIKNLNKSMHNDDPAYYKIPDDRKLISQYLLLYQMSLPFGLDLNEQLTPDHRYSRLTASMPSLDTKTDIAVDDRIWAWEQQNLPPGMQNRNTALSNIWSRLTIHSLVNSLEGSGTALLLISLVMLLMLRSLRYGIISLIPNLLPVAFGFGFWYLYSGNVGLGLTCVAIITIGIVVDDTVHFLVKYQKNLKDNKGDSEAAVRATFRQVGSALFMTTAVLAGGFSVLGLSKIIINSALGQVTTVILIAAFVLDVVLLPVLLLIFDRNRKQQYQGQEVVAEVKKSSTAKQNEEADVVMG